MEHPSLDLHGEMIQDVHARQERWTRDVTQLMAVVIIAAAAVISVGVWLRWYSLQEASPIYVLLALILPVWLLARGSAWRLAGYFPAALCLALGITGTLMSGYSSTLVLFYGIAVILAGMMKTSRESFIFAGLSLTAYYTLGYLQADYSIQIEPIITVTFGIIGIALLQRYIEVRFRYSLEAQIQINLDLQAEAERRRRAELELREQENQLRRLAENTTDLVAEIETDGKLAYVSPSYRAVLGYEVPELIGSNAYELLHPDDREAAHALAVQSATSRLPAQLQARMLHADGTIMDVEISGTPLYDETGRHTGFVLNSRDITLRRQAESAVQESESKFRHIIESLPLGIHMYNLDDGGRLVLSGYNPAANQILGMDHEKLVGLSIEEAFPGLAGSEIPRGYYDVAVNGGIWKRSEVEYDLNDRKGAFEVHTFQTAPGKVVAVFTDISERLRTEEAVRASEAKFSTAFQTSPDSVNINRLADGVYLDINQGFTAIMGYSREDVIGKSSLELNIWADPTDRERLVRGLQERGVVENLEARFCRKDGVVAVGLMSARVIMIRGEKCILSITRDISARIQSELELREAHTRLEQAYEATLVGWARALELRERETADHSQRVVEQTVQMAQELGVSGNELMNIRRGAMLHDIGKVGVPDSILLKPGPLTPDEWVSMRQHVEFAYDMLSGIEYLHECMDIPYCHHEKWDGTGYPRELAGKAIPLAARIFAVVDVFDALTHDRPYRPAWSYSETRRYLREQRGKHFDPDIVDLFLRMQGTGSL